MATTATPKRTIQDLRAQIIANGTVIRPSTDPHYGSDDHIELIVAKTPALAPSQQAYRNRNFNEKQTMNADGTFNFPQDQAPQSSSSSATTVQSKHYAVLIRRNGSGQKIRIIIKGHAKNTVEEALEWMLEKTEMIMHDLVVQNGKQDDGDCVMM